MTSPSDGFFPRLEQRLLLRSDLDQFKRPGVARWPQRRVQQESKEIRVRSCWGYAQILSYTPIWIDSRGFRLYEGSLILESREAAPVEADLELHIIFLPQGLQTHRFGTDRTGGVLDARPIIQHGIRSCKPQSRGLKIILRRIEEVTVSGFVGKL